MDNEYDQSKVAYGSKERGKEMKVPYEKSDKQFPGKKMPQENTMVKAGSRHKEYR